MQIDQNNNEILLTHQIAVPSAAVDENSQSAAGARKDSLKEIKSLSYLPTYGMLVLTLRSGDFIIGKLSNTFELGNCVTVPALASLKKTSQAQ